MNIQHNHSRQRSAGLLLAITAILFFIGIVWHGFVHPSVGATLEFSMHLIQRAPTVWVAMHMFVAVVSALFAAAALSMLAAGSPMTASLSGLAGWSVLTIVVVLLTSLAVFEATVQGDAAVAGDVTIFARSFALSRGYELILGLLPIAFLGIALDDLRSAQPATPRWASGAALAGAALTLVGVVGASGFRVVALGILWGGAVLPLLWFIWVGLQLAFAAE